MLHFIKLGHHTVFMLQQVLQHINQHFNIPNYSLQVQQRFRPWKWIPVWDSQEVLQLCPVELLPPDLRLASRLFSNYKSKWCGQADRRQRRTELQLQQAEGLLRAGHHKLFSHCLALIADEACGNRIVSGARGYSCFETCSNNPNVVCGFESWWVCPTREQRSHIPGSILRQVRFESKSNRKCKARTLDELASTWIYRYGGRRLGSQHHVLLLIKLCWTCGICGSGASAGDGELKELDHEAESGFLAVHRTSVLVENATMIAPCFGSSILLRGPPRSGDCQKQTIKRVHFPGQCNSISAM